MDEKTYSGNDKRLEKMDELNPLDIRLRSMDEKLDYLMEKDALYDARFDQLEAEVRVLKSKDTHRFGHAPLGTFGNTC